MHNISNIINTSNLQFLLLILVFNISCSRSARNPTAVSAAHQKSDSLLQKPPSSFSDSITIDYPAAVFYYPDSMQLDKIRAITDTSIFESAMHESFYQIRNSRMVLKKYYPHIKIVEVKNTRFILFKQEGGAVEIIDLNTKNDAFGLFVFNRYKSSRFIDMTNIDTELGFYFNH